MRDENAVRFFSIRNEYFGKGLIPKSKKELHDKWVSLDMEDLEGSIEGEQPEILGFAFNYFNWVWNDFEAPSRCNTLARLMNCHVSASVGDVFQIIPEGETVIVRWFLILPYGFKELFV